MKRPSLNPNKSRYPDRRGRNNGNAKLTVDEVRGILLLVCAGHRYRGIARKFGIAPSTIGRIVNGERWQDLEKIPWKKASRYRLGLVESPARLEGDLLRREIGLEATAGGSSQATAKPETGSREFPSAIP